MSASSAAALLSALEATWPAAETLERDGWRLRRGAGGGRRVSAATALSGGADIGAAETAMADWGQTPLFQLRPGDDALDAALAARGYLAADPTEIFTADPARLLDDKPETVRIIRGPTRIALIDEIWAKGGVGPTRLAVMDRAPEPKTYIVARLGDRPAAVAFVAVAGGIAMIHAVE
ncbi:MAG: GNAT family N-acetyltransferase, partial [Paracoccaceae bacterium]